MRIKETGNGFPPMRGLVEIKFYTDPLCCWSWAFEGIWKKFLMNFGTYIKWSYSMCGMIPDWNSYSDPLNAISRPQQMGPLWFQAEQITGVPINSKIWLENPPESSYPACIAVKCAELQSLEAGRFYLDALWEAVMLNGQNISKMEVISDIGKQVEKAHSEIFNFNTFESNLRNGDGIASFKEDMMKVRYYNITRYPTITFHRNGKQGVMITGFQPYESLLQAFFQVAPELELLPSINS